MRILCKLGDVEQRPFTKILFARAHVLLAMDSMQSNDNLNGYT